MTNVAELAQKIWDTASPVILSDPSTGANIPSGLQIRRYQDALVTLIRNEDGVVVNLFRVYPDGRSYMLGDLKFTFGALR